MLSIKNHCVNDEYKLLEFAEKQDLYSYMYMYYTFIYCSFGVFVRKSVLLIVALHMFTLVKHTSAVFVHKTEFTLSVLNIFNLIM